MSRHEGYGGRAGVGGEGIAVPLEPLHREGRDALSQWLNAQAERDRFGPPTARPQPKTAPPRVAGLTARRAEIVARHRAGETVRALAQAYDVTPAAIHYQLNRAGAAS